MISNKASIALVVISVMLGSAVLSALGTWQVKRMFWKEALIERVENKLNNDPVPLDQLLAADNLNEQEYRPVTLEGEFDHDLEVYFFTTGPNGMSGWNVHTPLKRQDGSSVIVNRGFVPDPLREKSLRPEGLVSGNQQLVGLLRIPVDQKPNRFVPENNLEDRTLFWRNHSDFLELMAKEDTQSFLPVMVDSNIIDVPGGWPRGDTTIVSFPNNHLQYAITWFGLAVSLLVVGGFFLYSRIKRES